MWSKPSEYSNVTENTSILQRLSKAFFLFVLIIVKNLCHGKKSSKAFIFFLVAFDADFTTDGMICK